MMASDVEDFTMVSHGEDATMADADAVDSDEDEIADDGPFSIEDLDARVLAEKASPYGNAHASHRQIGHTTETALNQNGPSPRRANIVNGSVTNAEVDVNGHSTLSTPRWSGDIHATRNLPGGPPSTAVPNGSEPVNAANGNDFACAAPEPESALAEAMRQWKDGQSPPSTSGQHDDNHMASEPTANDTSGAATASEPEPASEEVVMQWTEAKLYWSQQRDLGFGHGSSQRNPYESLEDFRADTAIVGAPIANKFYKPNVVADRVVIDLESEQESPQDAEPPDLTQADKSRRASSTRGTHAQRDRGRGRGRGRGISWALKGTEHDPVKRKAAERAQQREHGRSRPRGGSRGRPRGDRAIDPGREFKKYQTEATQAWMDGDLEAALESARLAVQANPEVFAAHSLLSEILVKMDRKQDALAALMSGAHTKRDPTLWNEVAQRTLDLAGDECTDLHREQALFAYSNALGYSLQDVNNNYIARTGKRDMCVELGNYKEARLNSKGMLRMRPDDWDNIRRYAELCAETEDPFEYQRAKEAYDTAFNMCSEKESLGDSAEQWSHANVYLELMDRLAPAERNVNSADQARNAAEAIYVLRRLARWFLGRKEELFWDECRDDDREFDSDHDRRAFVGEFQQGRASRDKAQYGDGLPLELRAKLGLFRIKMGTSHHTEGLKHLDHLLQASAEVEHLYDIFLHVADTLRAYRLWTPALDFYEAITEALEIKDVAFSMSVAQCYVESEQHDDAEDTYKSVIQNDKANVPARVELAKMYERTGRKDLAIPLIKDVIKLGRKDLIRRENLLPRNHPRPVKQKTQKPDKRSAMSPPQRPSQPTVQDAARQTHQQTALAAGERPAMLYIAPKPDARLSEAHVQYPTPAPSTEPPSQPSLGTPPPTTLNAQQRHTNRLENRLRRMQGQEHSVEAHHRVVEDLWSAVEEGEDEEAAKVWMHSAGIMVNAFRHMDVFYPLQTNHDRTRNSKFVGYVRGKGHRNELDAAHQTVHAILDRLRDGGEDGEEIYEGSGSSSLDPSVPRDLHGILFTEWHRIFVDLALVYARFADQARCYDLLKEGLFRANVFAYDPMLNNTSFAAALCCGLMFNDSAFVADVARKYITVGDYRAGMSYQLLASVNRLCYGADCNSTNSGSTQKFVSRMVRTLDHMLLPEDVRNTIECSGQNKILNKRLEKLGGGIAELDAGLLMLYGNLLVMSTHVGSISALSCYLRALALQPDSFSVNLSVGVTYIQRAMKRQTENRQYGIQQGLSFLHRYYELRTASGIASHLQEAEYNMAKTWHMLGLTHLAVPGYEKVLGLSGKVRAEESANGEAEVEDFAREAAFALQQMFALAGNNEAVTAITEQWLVI